MTVTTAKISHAHVLEKCGPILSDFPIRRHQTNVGIHGSRFFIVISRPNLGNILIPVSGLTGNQANLRVNLVVFESINHPASGILQTLRPVNIILLVKPGAKFDQNRDFLAVFRSRT